MVWFFGEKNKTKPLTPENAMRVKSVDEEYNFIRQFTCECGQIGGLKRTRQALLTYDGRPMDELDTECNHCGAKYNFYFDISDVPLPNFGDGCKTMGESYAKYAEFNKVFDIKPKKDASKDDF